MKFKLTLYSLLLLTSAFSQEVISTQGDSYTNANGKIDFTIGEVVIETGTDGNHDLTQGFHQTNWNFVGFEDHDSNIEISVYPNPIDDLLSIEADAFENLKFVLFDASGRVIIEDQLRDVKTKVQSANLLPATYTLVIQDQDEIKVKTFKLIKAQ